MGDKDILRNNFDYLLKKRGDEEKENILNTLIEKFAEQITSKMTSFFGIIK